jgi:hypothetical protein
MLTQHLSCVSRQQSFGVHLFQNQKKELRQHLQQQQLQHKQSNLSNLISFNSSKQHSKFIGAEGIKSPVTFEVLLDIAYSVTYGEYPLHSLLRVNLPMFLNFKVVVSCEHNTVNVSGSGATYNHSLDICNGIQYVLLNFKILYSQLLGIFVVDGCNSVDSQSTSET